MGKKVNILGEIHIDENESKGLIFLLNGLKLFLYINKEILEAL